MILGGGVVAMILGGGDGGYDTGGNGEYDTGWGAWWILK